MPNLIEITIRGRNELGTALAEAKAEAEAFGKDTGKSFSSGMSKAVEDDSQMTAERLRQALAKAYGAQDLPAEDRSAIYRAYNAMDKDFGDLATEAKAGGAKVGDSFAHGVDETVSGMTPQGERAVKSAFRDIFGPSAAAKAGGEQAAKQLFAGLESGLIQLGPLEVMRPDGTWGKAFLKDVEDTGFESGSRFATVVTDAMRTEGTRILMQGGVLGDATLHAMTATGANAGREFTAGFTDAARAGLTAADVFGFLQAADTPLGQRAVANAHLMGGKIASAFRSDFTSTMNQGLAAGGVLESSLGASGGPAGRGFAATFSEAARTGITSAHLASILDPAGPAGGEIVGAAGKAGTAAGKAAGGAMGPLIIGGFALAATAGPGILLTAMAGALTGIAVLVAHSNDQIKANYDALGRDIAYTMDNAVAPLIPAISTAIGMFDQGLIAAQPQIRDLFTSIRPDITAIGTGLSGLVSSTLPGVTSAMRAIAPFASSIADDFSKIGGGLGGFFAGLGAGAAGGSVGFSALADVIAHVLPDIGQLVGVLSNGLGPALHDVAVVALPVADALTRVVSAIPPGAIQAAALAVGALFTAFKIGTMANLVTEGTTFTAFLKGEGIAATEAAGATAVASKAFTGLGGALTVATGPLGLIIAGAAFAGSALDSLAGLGDRTSVNIDDLTGSMLDAARGSTAAQDKITQFAGAVSYMSNIAGGKAVQGMQDLDQALVKLYQSNPGLATTEFNAMSKAMQAQGTSAQDVAKYLPGYTQAVQDARLQTKLAADTTDKFAAALDTAWQQLVTSAKTSAQGAVAALDFGNEQSNLNAQLYLSVNAYQTSAAQASGYNTVLQAMNGNITNLLGTEAQFTLSLDSLTKNMQGASTSFDVNNAKGAQNVYLTTLMAQAAQKAAVAVYQNEAANLGATKAYQDANAKLADEKTAFIAAADAAGGNKTQVQKLADELFKLPPDIQTSVTVDASQAWSQIDALSRAFGSLNGQTGNPNFTLSPGGSSGGFSGSMNRFGQAHGGIIGAASGGARGNLVRVGEQGEELVRLPYGSTVISHPDMQSLTAQGAGGAATRLQLEWVGGSAGDEFMTWLRKNIRVRGGNVQTVLGHG